MTFTEANLVVTSDGLLNIELQPPTAIGGWSIQFQVSDRFDSMSGSIIKSCASGYGGGQSGITVTNSGQGQFQTRIYAGETSGWNPGLYAMAATRTDSGFVTPLSKGWLTLLP